MTEGPRGATPPGGGLDQLLLDAKLSIPEPRPGAVSRAELVETVRTSGCRLVGVTAPAGYGKSTLLGQWAATEQRGVGWLSLDRYDDDPAILLALLASAYVRACDADPDLVADVAGMGSAALGRAAPRLASALRASPRPFVLMLDDLHELRSAGCHDVLGVVLAGVPPHSQVVSASRSEQPHLPSLRPSGDVIELRVDDLALDAAAAEEIFAAAKVPIGAVAAAAVAERTEGWAVGVHLAAMIAVEAGGQGPEIVGDDRYVADYLYRESLSQLPEADQQFLRRTALLDRLTAPLCDAVLDATGSQEHLRRLEGASAFLVPLDRRRQWYRYHALFREFLLGELRRVDADDVPELHLRAADWYEANGSPAMAVEHLLHTDERDRCVRLVTAIAQQTYQAGQLSTVGRWLTTLGDGAIEGHPPLALLAGWFGALEGRTTDAERWAKLVEAAAYDGDPGDGAATFESSRAMLRAFMCIGGPAQAVADAELAVAQEPAWSRWRGVALTALGEAQLAAGDPRVEATLVEATDAAAAIGAGGAIVLSQSQLALLAMDAGRWDDAEAHVRLAVETMEARRLEDQVTSVLAYAAAARLALHRGTLEVVQRELTRAMRARPRCTTAVPTIAVRLRLQLAKTHAAIAEVSTARHLLREIDDILTSRPDLGTLAVEVATFRESLASSAPQGAPGRAPLSPAELRLLPYLQTHLTIPEIAERLYVSRNTASTHVKSIYRKMGVASRSEAVEQATSVGLLGG